MNATPASKKCGYAHEGTYGHECGKPATIMAVSTSNLTYSGLYYSGRCAECAKHRGRDNTNIIRFEQIGDQINAWNGRYK